MGIGDEIMAAGRAEMIAREIGRPVCIIDRHNRPRWHSIWDRNPAITRASDEQLRDGVGVRGYIKGWALGPRALFVETYRNADHPGSIYPPEDLREWANQVIIELGLSPYIVIEPHVRAPSSMNKHWGFDRWAQVAERLDGVVQLGADPGEARLPGATFIHTPTFWHAAAIIEGASLVMCPEGGTHHMAGALRVPAVVIYGAYVNPKTTGYDGHKCLYVETEEGACGRWDPCTHCESALASITPDIVLDAARELGVLETA